MNLQHRILLLSRLGEYILSGEDDWQKAVERAGHENGWFIPDFTEKAAGAIATHFLQPSILENWVSQYKIRDTNDPLLNVGIIMAGNIPLAGFHDWMTVFLSGNRAVIKPSSKDQVLIKKITDKLVEWEPMAASWFQYAEMLKGCDAYIATGSYNSSRYFDYYFSKYPHVIRRNRTSVAILNGEESNEDLEKLADDICLYFGLGCRNVTKIYVPHGYDFLPLLAALKKYNFIADHHKYKNNYDYNLALHLLNKVQYMTNGSVLLIENKPLFSPVSQLNYEFYSELGEVKKELTNHADLQCIVGNGHIPFGMTQVPSITDYADGVDTFEFLSKLTIR